MKAATIISLSLLVTLQHFLTLSSGFLFKHVATKHFIKDQDSGTVPSQYLVTDGNNLRYQYADFKWVESQRSGERQLASQWATLIRTKDKCMYVNNDSFPNEKEYYVGSQDCSNKDIQEHLSWATEDAGNGTFVIRHVKSGLCLKPEDSPSKNNKKQPFLAAARNCSASNEQMLWTIVE